MKRTGPVTCNHLLVDTNNYRNAESALSTPFIPLGTKRLTNATLLENRERLSSSKKLAMTNFPLGINTLFFIRTSNFGAKAKCPFFAI